MRAVLMPILRWLTSSSRENNGNDISICQFYWWMERVIICSVIDDSSSFILLWELTWLVYPNRRAFVFCNDTFETWECCRNVKQNVYVFAFTISILRRIRLNLTSAVLFLLRFGNFQAAPTSNSTEKKLAETYFCRHKSVGWINYFNVTFRICI